MMVVKHWDRLPREMVNTPSLETFSDRALSNLICGHFEDVPACCRGFGLDDF